MCVSNSEGPVCQCNFVYVITGAIALAEVLSANVILCIHVITGAIALAEVLSANVILCMLLQGQSH